MLLLFLTKYWRRSFKLYLHVFMSRSVLNGSCAKGRQWCGIFHYHWWTASIKPRLLFSHAGYASWGAFPFISLNYIIDCSFIHIYTPTTKCGGGLYWIRFVASVGRSVGPSVSNSCPLYNSFTNEPFRNCQSWSFITVHCQF